MLNNNIMGIFCLQINNNDIVFSNVDSHQNVIKNQQSDLYQIWDSF